jgi:peptide/nickel transport system substrate-binding protein
MKRRHTSILLKGMVLLLLVTSPGYARGGREEATGSQGPARSHLDFAISGNPDTLDPHATSGTLTFQVVRSIYDTLLEPNAQGDLVPALAESWEVSPDGLEWTFRLRRDVVFHHGRELTSGDVVATINRIIDPGFASPNISDFEAIDSVAAVDGYTVRLTLSRPHAPLLGALASGWAAILPQDLIASGHDFGGEPVGTGPFVFEEWVRDSRIVLRKNEAYWLGGRPRIDGVTFFVITEQAVQIQGLITGELDVVDIVTDTDVDLLKENPETKVDTDLSSLVMVVAVNNAREPFDDLRLRQAISLAIDRQPVLDVAYGGGEPVGSFIDSGDPAYPDFADVYPYNPARARELLEEVDLPEGFVLRIAVPQNFQPHVRAAEIYQSMLTAVGLNVELRLLDWSTWLSEVYRGSDFDLTVIGHTGKLDPDGRLGPYDSPDNYVGWHNREAAGLIAEARRETDQGLRERMYTRVLEIMAVELPHVYIGSNYRHVGLRENVQGFHMDGKLDTYDLRNVELR